MRRSFLMVSAAASALAVGVHFPLPRAAQAESAPAGTLHDDREVHLANVRQLTHGLQNAEAYWSADGKQLIFQSIRPPYQCDQIFRVTVDQPAEQPLVSSGKGRTTCSYFFPDGQRILYASTHLAGDACPANPDHSQGYVWPVYNSFEIFTAKPDGSDLQRLTANMFYDAEATICSQDGSILFTSDRDGDLELYRMDHDGKNVKRLTHTPGYDGGGFFSADCSKIVWRAARATTPEALAEDQRLLADQKVRPGALEIYVGNADGSDARQVTYLGAASFAPYFFPAGDRIIFSSNYGDPQGREFDLWAIDTNGTHLERITYTGGFDGFPMFSPDGKRLAFSSNRNQGGPHQTDIYVADWVATPPPGGAAPETAAAERFIADVRYLADDARQGRGLGSNGVEQAAVYLEERMRSLGLEPAGDKGTFRNAFQAVTAVQAGPRTTVAIDGQALAAGDFVAAGASASGRASGAVVAAGYGVTAPELKRDDYAGLDVRGKLVAVRRFAPDGLDEDQERRYGDLHYKAFNAREHGAVGLLVVDSPEVAAGKAAPDDAPLPTLRVDTLGDGGLPIVLVTRAKGAGLFAGEHSSAVEVDLQKTTTTGYNVAGRIAAGSAQRLPGVVLLGAHFDHLGMGGESSLAPGVVAVHHGADDNASGTAALLEAARGLLARRSELRRDVVVVGFSGEEEGLLGSTAFTRHPPTGLQMTDLVAMLNLDMVGRVRENRIAVQGVDSAAEWRELVAPACARAAIECTLGGDGYGPSDQTPFYADGVPVLFFFSGAHSDYHKPSDTADKINAAGGARVAALVADLAAQAAGRETRLAYHAVAAPAPSGDVRSFGASLGTVPDYVGTEDGRPGVLLAGVRPGGPADKAGMRRGDLLVELAGHPVRTIYDFMYILRGVKPSQSATAVVERDGKRVELPVIFGVARRPQ